MNGDYWMGIIIGYCCGTGITFLMIWFGVAINNDDTKKTRTRTRAN